MFPKIAKLTGTPDFSGFVKIDEFSSRDAGSNDKRGRLFIVLSLQRENEEKRSEIITRIREEYFSDLENSSYNALTSAVNKVVSGFKGMNSLDLVAISLVGKVVYTVALGGGKVSILRSGAHAFILSTNVGEASVASASGHPEEGDRLIAGTSSFFEVVSPEELTKEIQDIASLLQSTQGAVIIDFEKREKVRDFFARLIPERSIRIRGAEIDEGIKANRKVMVSIGLILLSLLFVSIGFGVRQSRINKIKAGYESRLTQAEHDFEESLALVSLNPERGRELFVSAKKVTDELVSENVSDPRLSGLKSRVDENEGKILGDYKVALELFLDLGLLSSGFNGDDLASSGEEIFILDKNGKKIAQVTIATKKSKIAAGPDDVEGAESLASYEDRVFIGKSDGIYEVGDVKNKVAEVSVGELIYLYAGNIYSLNKSEGTIKRFPGTGKEFGNKQDWLSPSTKPDFSDSKTLTIDGSIYVLFPNGKILKYTLGAPKNFAISGVFPELVSAEAIYTNEENKYIYILDKMGKRIVVLDKEGGYKAQYTDDRIGEATDLVVSETEKKIILLSGSKLYSIEAKHL